MAKNPETLFKEKVLKDLRSIGAWCFKVEAGAVRGIPDIIACYKGFFIGLELKKNKASKADKLQQYNINKIKESGGMGFVVYPQIWGETLRIIKGGGTVIAVTPQREREGIC